MSASPVAARVLALLSAHIAGTCLCCLTPTGRPLDLCRPCERDLPHAGTTCPGCGNARTAIVCENCGDNVIAPCYYRYPVDRLILRFKSGAEPAAATLLAALVHPLLDGWDGDAVVPVPLHPARVRARGFNQAAEIARSLGVLLDVPVLTRGVARIRDTPAQQSLSASQRARNVRGAFEARAFVQGQSLLIVDDVITTGATTSALAAALIDAGARDITVAAPARTPLSNPRSVSPPA